MRHRRLFQADWSPKYPLIFLALFVILIRPGLLLFIPELRVHSLSVTALCFGSLLGSWHWSRHIRLQQLFQNSENLKVLLPGFLLGAVVAFTPFLLDTLIEKTALADEPLFTGAQARALDEAPLGLPLLINALVVKPFLGQVVVMGLCLAPLLKKIPLAGFLGLSGFIFMLVFWDFKMASVLIGVFSGCLLFWTGSIVPGLVFQGLCGVGGLLLLYVYPRSITLLGFLF